MTLDELAGGTDDVPPADRIAWRQICIGYGLVLIVALVVGASRLGHDETMKGTLTALVIAATLVSMILERPAAWLHKRLLAERPAVDDALQWVAIVILVACSGGTIAAGILTLPASG
jgi:hypothetical protein